MVLVSVWSFGLGGKVAWGITDFGLSGVRGILVCRCVLGRRTLGRFSHSTSLRLVPSQIAVGRVSVKWGYPRLENY